MIVFNFVTSSCPCILLLSLLGTKGVHKKILKFGIFQISVALQSPMSTAQFLNPLSLVSSSPNLHNLHFVSNLICKDYETAFGVLEFNVIWREQIFKHGRLITCIRNSISLIKKYHFWCTMSLLCSRLIFDQIYF